MGDVFAYGFLGTMAASFVTVVVWILGLCVSAFLWLVRITGYSPLGFCLDKWWIALIAFILFAILLAILIKLLGDCAEEEG